MRSLARELNTSECTLRKKMAQYVHYKSSALRRGQFLSQATKERRLEKAKLMLNKLKNFAANGQLIFFLDKKNFSKDQKVNWKNNRWLCADIGEVPFVLATKFPAKMMVQGISATRVIWCPLHIFTEGLKVDTEEYLKVRKEEEALDGQSGRSTQIVHPGLVPWESLGVLTKESLASQQPWLQSPGLLCLERLRTGLLPGGQDHGGDG